MKCLKPKSGYTLFENTIVTVPCYTFSSSEYSAIYNFRTFECMILNRLVPGCKEVNN